MAYTSISELPELTLENIKGTEFIFVTDTSEPVETASKKLTLNSFSDKVTTLLDKTDLGLGNVDNTADIDKNVLSATKLTTPRVITIIGDSTGSTTFDGSANAIITLETNKTNLLSDILTIDGTGSAIDADLLDGQHGSYYATASSVATLATLDPVITLTGAVTGTGTMTNLGNVSIVTTATNDPVITLNGDVTGTGTLTNLGNVSISVEVINDSHTHDSRYFTELETDALYAKKIGSAFQDFYTKDLTVAGNLNVTGTTTTINTEILSVADNIIILNSNATDIPSENAGIEIERGLSLNTSIRWNETTDQWEQTSDGTNFYELVSREDEAGLEVLSANKLSTSRVVQLSGAVTGSANFDGTANINIITTHTADPVITLAGDATGSVTLTNLGSGTLTVTVLDDSHNHVISNVDGLQLALDNIGTVAEFEITLN